MRYALTAFFFFFFFFLKFILNYSVVVVIGTVRLTFSERSVYNITCMQGDPSPCCLLLFSLSLFLFDGIVCCLLNVPAIC